MAFFIIIDLSAKCFPNNRLVCKMSKAYFLKSKETSSNILICPAQAWAGSLPRYQLCASCNLISLHYTKVNYELGFALSCNRVALKIWLFIILVCILLTGAFSKVTLCQNLDERQVVFCNNKKKERRRNKDMQSIICCVCLKTTGLNSTSSQLGPQNRSIWQWSGQRYKKMFSLQS